MPAQDDDGDPERANATQARAPNPLMEEDPEAGNATVAKPNPLKGAKRRADDPAAAVGTVVKAPNPLMHADQEAPPRPARKKSSAKAPKAAEPEYDTNHAFQSVDEDEPMAGALNLEGDGLEPMEEELGPRTKALPALESDDEGHGEAEGGGEEEQEEADDANATHAGPPITLEVVEGPDRGKKKKFRGVRMVIGRTAGVDFLLTDQSVSRRHVELVQSDKGVLLRDLGSGNGSKVNGSKIGEKMLEHGDEISIGKTKLRYVDEVAAFAKLREDNQKKEAQASKDGEAKVIVEGAEVESGDEGEGEGSEEEDDGDATGVNPPKARSRTDGPPARRPRPGRGGSSEAPSGVLARFKALPKPMRLGITGGVVFVLLLLIVGLATRKPPPPPEDPNKKAAELKYQEARLAVRDGNFDAAVKAVEAAEALLPGIDRLKVGVQAREALAIQRQLEDAKDKVDQKKFDDARAALAKVPAEHLLPRFDTQKRNVEQALAEAEAAYKKAKAEEFLAAGELDSAKALLGELPVEQQPELAQKIAEFEKQLEQQKQQDEKDSRARAANAAAAAQNRQDEAIALAFAVVDRKFAGGEWDRAASECSRVIDANSGNRAVVQKAQALKGLIPNFGRSYDEGVKKFKLGQLAVAAKPLRQALQLYGQIGLKSNPYGIELQQKLAQASMSAGKECLLREDLACAATNFKDATKLDPSDTRARQGLEEVVSRADELFQSAYVMRDRDPKEALKRFRIVVDVTPSGSVTHEKAKNQIAAMAP